MTFFELLLEYGTEYLKALLMTWGLTALSFIFAGVLGIVLTICRLSPIKILRLVAEFYVQIFRNIPGAALLIILVYALPYLEVVLSYFNCVFIAVSLIVAAFFAENLLSGINTINSGQIEAARSLGFTFFQIIRYIVIPQAVRSSILPMTNLLIATMLTTSLASQVPLVPQDLTGIVGHINTHATGGILAFVISAVLYCATALGIGQLGNYIDRKVRIKR